MSDSVQPHRLQPTRLPHPWDSPGKNTGVGCHFLLQCMKVKSQSEVAQLCPTLCDPMDCPWNSAGQNTGVGSLSFLQGIFPTQGSNPGLLYRGCSQEFLNASQGFTGNLEIMEAQSHVESFSGFPLGETFLVFPVVMYGCEIGRASCRERV